MSLLPPADVHRYRDGDETDRADTKALLEAARNITIPVGARHLAPRAREAMKDGSVPGYLEPVLLDAITEVEELRRTSDDIERQLKHLARHTPDATLLMSVPGIGVLTATALVAYVGDVRRFRSGRHFAAYLGLTPREHSSALSRRLGRISKRGNSGLRMLLIHGARSVLCAAKLTEHPDGLRAWALAVECRSGHNTAAVALANKLVRITWRVWRDGRSFEQRLAA